MELRKLKPAMAVRGPQHCDVLSDVVEPDDTVHPKSLDWRLALELHTNFNKERRSSLEVVDNNEDVVHPQKRHIPSVGVGCLAMSVRVASSARGYRRLWSACSTVDIREL